MKKIIAIIIIIFICMSNVYAEEKSPVYSIYINAAARSLKLFCNEILIKEYPVAVGKPTTKSPLGSFTIRNKAVNPYWNNKGNVVAPGPKNPLGIRWLGISAPNGTYGIHGNNVPSSIGTFASAGCIRMYNNDVAELYSKVGLSTKVQISFDSIELLKDKYSNTPVLMVYPDLYKLKNSEMLMKKIMESNGGITQTQAAKALKLTAGNLTNPVAVTEGMAVLLNNQYITNAAFVEENQLYIYFEAAVDILGMGGDTITAYNIPVIEKNEKVYINLSMVAASIGGQIKFDDKNGNAYLSAPIVKVNGKYLCSYKGSFDKEYLLESDAIKQIGLFDAGSSKQTVNIVELCKQQNWKFHGDSLRKMIDIEIPLRIKVGDSYINTEFYLDRYYINSTDAAKIPDIQNQNLKQYSYMDKSYYDVYELMEHYHYQQDKFYTTIEFLEPLSNGV